MLVIYFDENGWDLLNSILGVVLRKLAKIVI